MEMGTTDKICCNCHHYRLGHLDDPCEQGNKKCGYLHEGCGMWEKAGERSEDVSGDIKPVVIQAKYGRQRRKWTEEEVDRGGRSDLERDVSIALHQND